MAIQDPSKICMRAEWYNKNCGIQLAAMRKALDLLPTFYEENNLTVIDYGCSQGACSIEPLKKVISSLPDGAEVNIKLEDTTYNDFVTLARTVDAELPNLSPNKSHNIYVAMIPRGFFNQVVSCGSVDIGWSWSSMNYLEKQPKFEIPAGSDMPTIQKLRTRATRAAGKEDIAKFLTLRAAEIRHGGYFLAAVGGLKPASETEETVTGAAPLGTALMKMIQAGKITPQEASKFGSWPTYDVTIEDFEEILGRPEIAALWETEVAQPRLIEHDAWKIYKSALEAGGDKMAKKAATETYARTVLTNLLSSSGWFWASILKEARGEDWHGEDEFLNDLTEVAVQECVAHFADMKMAIWYNYLRLKRRESVRK